MPVYYLDKNGDGIIGEGDEIVIAPDGGDTGGNALEGWGWPAAALGGGSYFGWEAGVATMEGFSALAEAGVIGAEYGSLAGPIGFAAGAVVGVASAYVIYNYHDEIINGWNNLL